MSTDDLLMRAALEISEMRRDAERLEALSQYHHIDKMPSGDVLARAEQLFGFRAEAASLLSRSEIAHHRQELLDRATKAERYIAAGKLPTFCNASLCAEFEANAYAEPQKPFTTCHRSGLGFCRDPFLIFHDNADAVPFKLTFGGG